MDLNIPESMTFSALDQKLVHLRMVVDRMQTFLQQARPASIPPVIYEAATQLTDSLDQLRKSIHSLENERRSLRALAQIGQYINSSLDLDVVLQLVMDTIVRITRAERGFMMLRDEQGAMITRIGRNWEQETLDVSELTISKTVVNRVAATGQPILTTNAQEDPRFHYQQSVVAFNLRSILCVPLKEKEEVTGVIYADSRIRSGLFTQKELDLLSAFANQAAVAIENARLFASVRQTLAEVTELKNLMDRVFSSMASGVLTTDIEERILLCNRSAENILGRTAQKMVGALLEDVFPPLGPTLKPYLDIVKKTDQSIVDLEASPVLMHRGRVDLRLSLSPLKDAQDNTQGVAIVLEDLTEKKKLEAQRRLFERMVSPAVIDRLDPNSLQLGGQRAEITVLFADIRGFTSFSESTSPEELVAVLNRYLAAAAEEILREGGTIDKFLGDAVMAWFNAPIPQFDHPLRAVRAALAIQSVSECLARELPSENRLSYGIGLHIGDAILGLVGTEKRLDYTAIGDSVNTAKRIQENASGNQILISKAIYDRVKNYIKAVPVEPVTAKGKREPLQVYQVLSMAQWQENLPC